MASGTLVPFLCEVTLPGDTFNINLNCEVLTLPTIGPLFGSYKIQLDVFEAPMRLYNAGLHMNRLEVGREMQNVFLPKVELLTNNHADYTQTYDDNEQISSSCIFKYLGISGLGNITGVTDPATRNFNAVPYLMYWDIYKNYYANKQEERGFVVHASSDQLTDQDVNQADLVEDATYIADIYNNPTLHTGTLLTNLTIHFGPTAQEVDPADIDININATTYTAEQAFNLRIWDDVQKTMFLDQYTGVEAGNVTWEVPKRS